MTHPLLGPEPASIGDTPLSPIRVPIGPRSVRLWLKLEVHNRFGSIKARTADALLNSLEATGELRPGRRVVESTSGNLGVALAGLCASRGYRCTLVVEPGTPPSSITEMVGHGAEVVTVPEAPGGRTVEARLEAVQAVLRRDPGAVWTNQYQNAANPDVHTAHTAVELEKGAPDNGFDAVAVSVSTGGTLAGIARYFRGRPSCPEIIAVDAWGSAALGGAPAHRPFKLAGFGSGRVSDFVERHHWDHVVRLRDSDAAAACLRLLRQTGVSLGGSAGAAVLAAVVRAAADPRLREVVCLCPDSGEKYGRLAEQAAADARDVPAEVRAALDYLDGSYLEETPDP